MSQLPAASTHPGVRRTQSARILGRWMVSFVGYPLGGYAAFLVFGPVDGPGTALAGGLLTGVTIGAVQAWAMGQARPGPRTWITATSLGLMAGVAAGAELVDYETNLSSLIVQGAVSGALVGVAQATVLLPTLGRRFLAWPLLLSVTFALGWTVTTYAGIDVDQQFTIFGSSGALVAALLTAVLPLWLTSHQEPKGWSSGPETSR
ncbi:conserved membrane hypothetical protein [metagenome]|uniref:Uncharacterized protein n=1 Tax=metagenome TaxID=256318 RepID=A0A2P2C7D3_9ZZZZ